MYSVDGKDRIVPLREVPQSSIGAPCPAIVADELTLVLAFYAESPRDPNWDGMDVRMVSLDTTGESAVLVTFVHPYAHFFGPPSDSTIEGHPLTNRGLRPYSAVEVLDSSWIRELEQFQATHASPQPKCCAALRHFVFAFHNSVFECVAKNFTIEIHQGSIRSLLPTMAALLSPESTTE